MNKTYQAVPLKTWEEQNPGQDFNLFPYEILDDGINVLVPIEEQWISMDDRLPEPDQSVLLWMIHKDERLSGYIHWTWEKESTSNITISGRKATHWRPDFEPPLPTSPKDTEQTKPLDK